MTTLIEERMPLAALAHPRIIVVDPKSLTVKEKPEGVTVLTAQQLRRWLAKRRAILSAPDVTRLAEIFDSSTTWHRVTAVDLGEARPRFEALHAKLIRVWGNRDQS